LENNWVALSQSKYARFIVSSTLKYCAGYRSIILKEFQGKVCKLVKHKEASLILDELYSQYANSTQRLTLMEEFYGPEFVLFKQVFLFNKAEGPKTIVDIIASNPSKQPFILKHLRNTLDSVLQKGTFNLGRTPILHKAIWDYLSISESKVSADMVELLKDHLVHILHTREGAKIAQYCLVHSGPKDRKQIIKSFKGFVHSIAKEKYGHMVLISAFECVDDTVLMGKSIVSELFKPPNAESNVFDLLIDQYGSRVILYLLTGRNKHHLPIFAINELGEFDSTRALTTKKEDAVRSEQLLEVASPLMIAFAQQSANTLMRDKIGGQVLLAILQYGKGDVQPILDTIISSISENLNMPDKQDQEIAEFHPIKKMRSEKEASKRASQGLLMHESLLFNRNSTFFIKNALSKKLESEWQLKFINDLWETVEPHFDSLLDYCILNHSHSAGTSLIFVAIWEFGESAINKKIRKLCKTKTFAATESVDDNGKRKQSDSTPAIKVLIDNACA
jgi:pumilio family protein 6